MRFVFQGLAAALGFWLASKLVHGVHVYDVFGLITACFLLAVLNMFVRPLLILSTLPLTIVTLGLFVLVVNGLTAWLALRLVHGVWIDGPIATLLTALIISIVSWLVAALVAAE